MSKEKISFLKKATGLEADLAEEVSGGDEPVIDNKLKVVFVNASKYKRAEDILALIKREKAPNSLEEEERTAHYRRQLELHGITPDSEDALPAVYEIIGGLMRTPAEQKQADLNKKAAMARAKKKMVE